jgi:DNA-directed RNA polymerase specialized sigma24 family protein
MALPGWQLSPQAFERFLAALDPNRDAAAERYEDLRSKLARFFEWRGTHFPEDRADEAINRVIRKIDEGEEVRDVRAYCYAVARLVLLEALKQQAKEQEAFHEFHRPAVSQVERPVPLAESSDIDDRLRCLRRCMGELPAENRDLISAYYREEGARRIDGRKRLAERLGIGINALRIRAFRLSDKLQSCVTGCVAGGSR